MNSNTEEKNQDPEHDEELNAAIHKVDLEYQKQVKFIEHLINELMHEQEKSLGREMNKKKNINKFVNCLLDLKAYCR